MPDFTPYESAIGGSMLGLAAANCLLAYGRVAGISGLLNGLLQRPDADTAWRATFLLGVVSGGAANSLLNPIVSDRVAPEVLLPFGAAQVGLAGLVVGAGTRLANGCTSGHGLCGLARFSRRSAAAVATFMATGMLTVVALDRAFGQPGRAGGSTWSVAPLREPSGIYPVVALVACAGALATTAYGRMPLANGFVAGSSFGMGLSISGMTRQDKVIGFLNVAGPEWDPSLAFVLSGGLLLSAASYSILRRRSMTPLLHSCHSLPTRTNVDSKLLGGSALFGAGWALGGFCPGPAVANLSAGLVGGPTFASAALFVGTFAVGSKLAQAAAGLPAGKTASLGSAATTKSNSGGNVGQAVEERRR